MRFVGRILPFVAVTVCLVVTACTGDDPVVVAPPAAPPDGGGGPGPGPGADGGGPGNTVDPPGKTCSVGTDCASGQCIDGFCCNRSCGEPCEACNLPGKEGTCSLVTGPPVGNRTACAGDGACAGSCGGTSPQCDYPATTVICGASCDGKCDGKGKCSSVAGGSCPGGFACSETGCKTSCTTKDDCQPFHTCSSGKCTRIAESNCLDGIDNNGDGLADCADPTCNAQVECVPAPATGGELGVFIATGSCPANYATAEPLHQTLQKQPCTGCSCQSTCGATTTLWANDNACGAGGTSTTVVAAPGSGNQCRNVLNTTYVKGITSTPQISGCTGSGTATQADPTWATNKTFCAAKVSATCADTTKKCVAKRTSTVKVCARGDSAAACPTGYSSNQNIWYDSFTPGSCGGSCSSCNPATAGSLTCKHVFTIAYTGSGCTGGGSVIDTSCGDLNRGAYASFSDSFSTSGTDNCTNNVTTVDPVATGATRVCCQP
jgi:hypothetical protein